MSTKPVVTYQEVDGDVIVGLGAFLSGVKDHPRGLRGDQVHTSTIVRVDGTEIETLNTIYRKAGK